MFGDKMLVGQYEHLVDLKGRLSLPTKTNREKDDTVILTYDDSLELYEIYSKQAIEKKFVDFENLILNSKSLEEEKKNKLMFLKFCKSVLRECRVDKSGRIMLGEEFKSGEKIWRIGANDHLMLDRKR